MRIAISLATAIVLFAALPSAAQESLSAPSGIINSNQVNVRLGPAREYDKVTQLGRGAKVSVLESQGVWTRIRLDDASEGWILSALLTADRAAAPASRVSSPPVFAQTTRLSPAIAKPSVPVIAKPVPAQPAPKAKGTVGAAKGTQAKAFPETRTDSTLDTRTSSPGPGDGFRLLLYLVPVLCLCVLAVRVLKSIQSKGGTPSSFKQALIGGFNLVQARKTGGSNIQVIESVAVGSASLHLVHIRGRELLLGTSGSFVGLVADLADAEPTSGPEFKALLEEHEFGSEAGDMDGRTLASLVGSLDERMRKTAGEVRRGLPDTAVTHSRVRA